MAPPDSDKKAILAKALMQHLTAKLGPSDVQGKNLIRTEVAKFMSRKGAASTSALGDMEKQLRGKLGGSVPEKRAPSTRPAPTLASAAQHQAGLSDAEAEFYAQMAQRDVKVHQGRRLKEILQEKVDDPWGKMATYEAEKQRRDDMLFREKIRQKKMAFKQQLDDQVAELQEKRRQEANELRRDFQQERAELEALAEEDQLRKAQKKSEARKLLEERQHQIRELDELRQRMRRIKLAEQDELNTRVAREQAEALAQEQMTRSENKARMRSYVAESERSQAVKDAALKKEEEAELAAKAQAVVDLEKKDKLKADQRRAMKARQDQMEERAKQQGVTWKSKEVPRCIPDHVIEKHEREFAVKAEAAEDAKIARKAAMQVEIREALDGQIQFRMAQEAVKKHEKNQWKAQFEQENQDIAREKASKMAKKLTKRKEWTAELDHQIKNEWSVKPKMSAVEMSLNSSHPSFPVS